ncbi:hypothetical protein V2G26_001462 [Clonostachys chloroleuca]
MLARRMSFVSRSYPRRLWEHLSDARIIVKPFTHSEAFIPNVAEVKGANFVDIFETMHFLNGQSARDKYSTLFTYSSCEYQLLKAV